MFDTDRWYEIYSTLRKNPLRTILTAFGVFWGIFILVIMLGSGNGLQNGVNQDFSGIKTNSFFVWAQRTSKPYMGMQPGRTFNYNNDDAKALLTIPELSVVAPRNQLGGYRNVNTVVRGIKNGAFDIMGDYPQYNLIEPRKITNGRFINQLDIKEKRKVCIIGERVRKILFDEGEEPVNDYIVINGIYFKVIGVFKASGHGDEGEQEANTIHVPFTTFQHAFNYGNVVGFFAITSKDNIPASEAEDKVIALLKQRHKIAPEDQLAIGHWNMEKEFSKIQGLFSGISMLVWIVGIGTLLAGVIGVSNIMLIVVKERTKEIGIRRAVGAPPVSIVTQIILESVLLTSVAGYFGLVLGVGLLEAVSSAIGTSGGMFRNPEVDINVALKALGILIFSGALAGLMPARKALQINTAEALRSE